MSSDVNNSDAQETGVATWIAEAVVAVLVFALGLTVALGSRKLGAGWGDDGPGAGYFPFYIGSILCICALVIFGQAVFAKQKDGEPFVTGGQFKLVMQVFLPAVVYVGVVQFLGLYVASAAYIALFMVYLGKYGWGKSLAVGIIINVVFFFMFEVWFKVPLFKGSLNPLGFLGY
ncbi:MAG: hypothetical protein RLZZ126_528 [Pseudomonadota bacterium]|jgi:hypothetical protein